MSVGTASFWIVAWATTFTLPYLFNQEEAGLGPMIGFVSETRHQPVVVLATPLMQMNPDLRLRSLPIDHLRLLLYPRDIRKDIGRNQLHDGS